MKRLGSISTVVAVVVLCLWMTGRISTDRWSWSQWLYWIPTLFVVLVCFVTTIIALFTKSRWKSVVFGVLAASLMCWFSLYENHLFTVNGTRGKLRIVGWTMSHSKQVVSDISAEEVVRFDGDITLLTHGWYVRGEPVIEEWLGKHGKRLTNGPFTILTALQPLEIKTLVASDGIYISMFVVDATPLIGKPLVLWAVDLPFSLSASRFAIATRALRLLESIDAPTPDIVIGDFNMTRTGASIQELFPLLHNASDDNSEGLLASYPMEFPLYHIDHILLQEGLYATSYQLVNPHIGRHRVQICEITLAE